MSAKKEYHPNQTNRKTCECTRVAKVFRDGCWICKFCARPPVYNTTDTPREVKKGSRNSYVDPEVYGKVSPSLKNFNYE